jgi:hypothetical protein
MRTALATSRIATRLFLSAVGVVSIGSMLSVMAFALFGEEEPTVFNANQEVIQQYYRESFETDFGGWQKDHYIACEELESPCIFEWSIERSAAQAYEGIYSLEGFINGRNDDGTIWMEKAFSLPTNSIVTVDLSFYLWSESQSQVNQWPVVAYIGKKNPEREDDLSIIGFTDEVAGWKRYSVRQVVTTDDVASIWIAFGFGATWEVSRTYFLDLVSVASFTNDSGRRSRKWR